MYFPVGLEFSTTLGGQPCSTHYCMQQSEPSSTLESYAECRGAKISLLHQVEWG
jgi:hypothetical protein